MKKGTRSASVSKLRSHLGFWMRFVSNHVSQTFGRKLLDSGVTVAEWVLLREMYDVQETSPSVLAEVTGLTRGAVSKLIDRLLAKELVRRRERSDDHRFQDIALTPAGRKLVPKLAAIADQNDEFFFAALTLQEREAMLAILQKLVQAHDLQQVPIQ